MDHLKDTDGYQNKNDDFQGWSVQTYTNGAHTVGKAPSGHNFLLNILVQLYHTKYGYNANYYCQLHFGSFVALTEMESLAFLANVGILFHIVLTNSEEKEREKFFFRN